MEFFGFPTNYSAYRSNVVIGGAGIQPLITFRPSPDPANGRENEGVSDITFAPPGFPNPAIAAIGAKNRGRLPGFPGRPVQGAGIYSGKAHCQLDSRPRQGLRHTAPCSTRY